MWPWDPREVDAGVVAQGDVIGPELVVERAAGFAEACADPLHWQPAEVVRKAAS